MFLLMSTFPVLLGISFNASSCSAVEVEGLRFLGTSPQFEGLFIQQFNRGSAMWTGERTWRSH